MQFTICRVYVPFSIGVLMCGMFGRAHLLYTYDRSDKYQSLGPVNQTTNPPTEEDAAGGESQTNESCWCKRILESRNH